MQHLVGSDILQSSFSYHTHTSSSQISLWRVCPIKGRRGVLTKRELSKTTVFFFCLWVLEACGRQACFNLLRVLGKDMPRMLAGGRLCASGHTPLPEMQVLPCGLLSTCRSWHPWTVGSRCTHVWRGFSRRGNHSKCVCGREAHGVNPLHTRRGLLP